MTLFKTKGIVIRRKDVHEADKIITLFTEKNGKVIARAKGVRRILAKNSGSVELFNLADFVLVQGKAFDILASGTIIESFSALKKNLNKTSIAYYFAELIDKLMPPRVRDKRIFDLMYQCLKALEDYPLKLLSAHFFVPYFQLNLLFFLGYQPELKQCLYCQKNLSSERKFFSYKAGGLLCHQCLLLKKENAIKVSDDAVKVMRMILEYPLPFLLKIKTPEVTQKEIQKISEKFLHFVTDQQFKSLKFMKKAKS